MKKTEQEILYFGADFLTVNFAKKGSLYFETNLFKEIEELFAIPHDSDNSSTYFEYDFFGETFTIDFRDIMKGDLCVFMRENLPIFEIIKISSKWAENINFKYLYRIEFKGSFFMLEKEKLFKANDFIKKMFASLPDGVCSVSRLDITCDISNIKTKDIFAGVPANRNSSEIGKDMNTGSVETYYIGAKSPSKNDRHLVRIYNKQNELIAKKKKAKYFKNYFQYSDVTRLEIEVRNQTSSRLQIHPLDSVSPDMLHFYLKKILKNTRGEWAILEFISENISQYVKDLDFEKEIIPAVPQKMADSDYLKRFRAYALGIKENYNVDPIEYLKIEFGKLGLHTD